MGNTWGPLAAPVAGLDSAYTARRRAILLLPWLAFTGSNTWGPLPVHACFCARAATLIPAGFLHSRNAFFCTGGDDLKLGGLEAGGRVRRRKEGYKCSEHYEPYKNENYDCCKGARVQAAHLYSREGMESDA